MRISALMLVAAATLALAGCKSEVVYALKGPPPGPSTAAPVPAYYSPTDSRVMDADPAKVTHEPVLTQP